LQYLSFYLYAVYKESIILLLSIILELLRLSGDTAIDC
jgi:hypothetical protein